jgi:hypothetical protein
MWYSFVCGICTFDLMTTWVWKLSKRFDSCTIVCIVQGIYFLLYTVNSTLRYKLYVQYDISANAQEIRAIKSPVSDVLLTIQQW